MPVVRESFCGLFRKTDIHTLAATVCKAAAPAKLVETRNPTRNEVIALLLGIIVRAGFDQAFRVGVQRIAEDIFRFSGLNDLAAVHDRDVIGDL